jgi:hypothetical protein
MTRPCMCDCGLDMTDGELCLDWSVVGMKRVCATVDGFAGPFQSSPDWTLLRDWWLQWENTTCRTHRVIANLDVPNVTIKIGGGNAWVVRGYIDYTINLGGPPPDLTREPELQWSANWYLAMPAGTDREQRAPGSAEREILVPPGDTLTAGFRFFARTANYTAQAVNFLEVADYAASLSAWPSNVDSGSGRTC